MQGQLKELRILLVDDSEDVLEMMSALLEMEDAVVTTATRGAQALEAAEQADFDLLISDVGMPDMNGYQLIAALRGKPRNGGIPAIALTGYGGDAMQDKALRAGFTDHVCKPVSIDTLIDKVLSLVQ